MQNIDRISRRITATLFAGQSLFTAAVIAMATVIPIVATDLTGDPSQAGLPSAITNLAAAPAAFLLGLLWERVGRRGGLALGLAFGIGGALVSLAAVQTGSFGLLLLGFAGFGVARAAMQLGRFIAAEVTPPARRGRAISYVVLGGTIGAVAGPSLVEPSGKLAESLGMGELAGPFGISVALFVVAVLIVVWGLNPEPRTIAEQIDAAYPQVENESGEARSLSVLIRLPAVQAAVASVVLSQMVMIMVMGMTSLHMRANGHELGAISNVFRAHTLGMFAFSVLTGRLADRWGRGPVILAGVGLLLASFALAPVSTATPILALALFLLGLGWNFCYVAGSALLSDQLTPAERARTQGVNDVFIGLASAGGSYASGLLLASAGYGVLNLVSAGLTLVALAFTLVWFTGLRRTPQLSLEG